MLTAFLAFLHAHLAALTWPVITGTLIVLGRWFFRANTPEGWVALGDRLPRIQGLFRFMRGGGLDPVHALSGLEQIVTGAVPFDAEARAALLAIENAALRAALARLGASPSTVIEASAVGRAPSLPSLPNPQSGRASVAAMAVCLVLSLALTVTGCPKLPPVSGCAPMSQRCSASGAPEVCSSSQRWEPAGDLSCTAAGGVCVVDAGIAHCAPAQDGGAR